MPTYTQPCLTLLAVLAIHNITYSKAYYFKHFKSLIGDHIGDACANDADGDGAFTSNDTCPNNPEVSHTSFLNHFTVDLDPSPASMSIKPSWKVHRDGSEVTQMADTNIPTMLIGKRQA